MSVSIANVNILTDTTQSFVARFNQLAFNYSTDALTANSTLGITGSVANPRNARLFGSFAANTVNSHVVRTENGAFVANSTHLQHGNFVANSTVLRLSTTVIANNAVGTTGQVLTSDSTGRAFWSTITGTGTVTSIVAGNGLNGNTITSTGTLSVRPADSSIIVTAAGIQVNAFFVSAISSNASTLLGRTWSAPAVIGNGTANSATFTTATATTFNVGGSFIANSTNVFATTGLELVTPVSGDVIRLRTTSGGGNLTSIAFTNNSGAASLGRITVNDAGLMNITTPTVNMLSLGVGTGITSSAGEIRASGNITAYQTSDIRLKTNIKPIESAVQKINTIGGYSFTWTDDAMRSRGGEDGYFVRSKDVGVIAQEIESILPEAVVERADGYKAVRYELLVPILIQAIKELSAEIEELKK